MTQAGIHAAPVADPNFAGLRIAQPGFARMNASSAFELVWRPEVVGVEERDERCARNRDTTIPCRRRTAMIDAFESNHFSHACEVLGGSVGRAVVDDDQLETSAD